MNRFHKVPTYDPRTGKPLGEITDKCGSFCDFCGKLIDIDDINGEVVFSIEEVGGFEQSFYYREFPELNKDAPEFDHFSVFANHPEYIYCTDEEGNSCSGAMIKEATNGDNLETVMQEARAKVVVKLINEGVTLEELDIDRE